MNIFEYILISLYCICAVTLVFGVYMQYRNNKVYEFRIGLIDNHPEEYKKLSSYQEMMNKWWEWDFTKFIKE